MVCIEICQIFQVLESIGTPLLNHLLLFAVNNDDGAFHEVGKVKY